MRSRTRRGLFFVQTVDQVVQIILARVDRGGDDIARTRHPLGIAGQTPNRIAVAAEFLTVSQLGMADPEPAGAVKTQAAVWRSDAVFIGFQRYGCRVFLRGLGHAGGHGQHHGCGRRRLHQSRCRCGDRCRCRDRCRRLRGAGRSVLGGTDDDGKARTRAILRPGDPYAGRKGHDADRNQPPALGGHGPCRHRSLSHLPHSCARRHFDTFWWVIWVSIRG